MTAPFGSADITDTSLSEWVESQEAEEVEVEEAVANSTNYPYTVAKVIFQAHVPWSTTVWVDVGREGDCCFPLEKDCPVLSQGVVVGIVDYVGAKASRIRLISDPLVRLAVRVVRGGFEAKVLSRHIPQIQRILDRNPKILQKPELTAMLSKLLACLAQNLPQEDDLFLAKGELQGTCGKCFSGVGFNYDFDDEEGKKRDLRSGQRTSEDKKIPLIMPGDLLVTSGLDGCFPKNLPVARVEKVFPLEEGAISYRIIASTEAKDFWDLEYVTIIPALPDEPKKGNVEEERIKEIIAEVP
jgi:cell shape-determining protein MreC